MRALGPPFALLTCLALLAGCAAPGLGADGVNAAAAGPRAASPTEHAPPRVLVAKGTVTGIGGPGAAGLHDVTPQQKVGGEPYRFETNADETTLVVSLFWKDEKQSLGIQVEGPGDARESVAPPGALESTAAGGAGATNLTITLAIKEPGAWSVEPDAYLARANVAYTWVIAVFARAPSNDYAPAPPP